MEIPLPPRARYICLLAFADVDENEHPAADKDVIQQAGQHLADAVLNTKMAAKWRCRCAAV